MKKISLFIVSLFAIGSTMAQTVDDFSAVIPVTDNNMSVVFPAGTLTDFAGGNLQAYVNGVPVSSALPDEEGEIASLIAADGSGGVAVIGTDALCSCDLANAADEISFAILMNGEIIVLTSVDPAITYAANTFEIVSGSLTFSIDGMPVVFGCTDPAYVEFDASANLDDGSCATLIVYGCMDAAADNFDAAANTEDGSCLFTGCTDASADNYDANANVDGYCQYLGCTDATACNFDASANEDDASCEGLVGCTDAAYYEFDASATCDNGSCASLIVPGCTDASAFNYNASATEDDGSCEAVAVGCTNPAADNFDAAANTNDADSCEYSGINPWGAGGGSSDVPTYITANNMSVLVQAGTTNNLNSFNGLDAGDVLFAVYETSRLENEYLGYSEVSGIQSAGAVVWTGDQVGIPVFGAGNVYDNGYEESEELVWLVEKADGVVYHVQILDAAGNNQTITWENGEFAIVDGISVGSPLYDGCMDPTAPNFDPLATTDDGSCATPYSIGCMDVDKVNFAGEGANPTHENAENFGDAFAQNEGYNLNTHDQFPSGIAANFSDDSYCQDQVEGCTDAMANNYDPLATQNDNTICDWSYNGMTEYNVDQDGNNMGTDYNFGAVDPENVNDGLLGSDFANAQILFDEGYLDVEDHVIDVLGDVMEWIDMDEARDAVELADTISDMQARYDANDAAWNAAYNANEAFLNDSIAATLDSAAVAFAADEAADLEFLNNTIAWWTAELDSTEVSDDAILASTIAASDALLAETIAASDALLALTIDNMQADYDANDAAHVALEGLITDSLDYHRAPIEIDLHTGWNTVAYYLHHESPVVAQFEAQFGTEEAVQDNINIVKNNEGLFYWPDFLFDGLGMMQPGQGYQVRVKDATNGKSDFIFAHSINQDDYRVLTPTVPAWAIEMDVQNHPNDVRSLVRVVNMLGQEVNPTEQFNGEVLLYMYNDGSVEKKMVD